MWCTTRWMTRRRRRGSTLLAQTITMRRPMAVAMRPSSIPRSTWRKSTDDQFLESSGRDGSWTLEHAGVRQSCKIAGVLLGLLEPHWIPISRELLEISIQGI
ncbi:unnamed protein product [Lasius platythorax]|uniref:Uncharacterized protein n=1 Tax=Lasius platythorax TaxID=488582 RepID=A0AAV2NFE3_9HYME